MTFIRARLDPTAPLPRFFPRATLAFRFERTATELRGDRSFSLLLSPFQALSASPSGFAAPVSRPRLRQKPHLPPSRARTAPRRPCRRAPCPQWEGASTLTIPA